MKKSTIWIIVVLIVLIAWYLMARQRSVANRAPVTAPNSSNLPATTTSGASTIDISGFAFAPASVSVAAGTAVTWTNQDSVAHNIVGDGFSSAELATGASFTHTFDTAGAYQYHCGIHPSMKGTIVVQ